VRNEIRGPNVLLVEQIVADQRLARAVEQMQRSRVADAIDTALADVNALVAEHRVVVRVDELVAEVHDVVDGALRAVRVAPIEVAPRAADQAVAVLDDIGQARQLLFLEHDRARQERPNLGIRNRRDCALERQLADARREALDTAAAAHSGTALQLNRGPAVVQINERQRVARIDKVRILDLRVDLPDLGPIPRVAEKLRSDIPERVATLHDVGFGMARVQDGRRRRLPDGGR
jgi:hypothetical protein